MNKYNIASLSVIRRPFSSPQDANAQLFVNNNRENIFYHIEMIKKNNKMAIQSISLLSYKVQTTHKTKKK